MSSIKLSQLLAFTEDKTLNFSGAESTIVGKTVLQSGLASYESLTLATCITLLKQSPNKVFFDIGANIGIYSLVCAKAVPNIIVHAFEPVPNLANIFSNLIELNKIDNIFLHQVALGDKCGIAQMYISARSDASNSLRKGFRPAKEVVEVELDTLSNICQTNSIPSVIKIDTESTEPDVIAGGINLIKSARPFMICEVLAGRTENALMEVLSPLNYTYYHLDKRELGSAKEVIKGDRSHECRDWLFCPHEMPATFFTSVAEFHQEGF
ncbi:MAG: FkbM family methyltransferase [Okeania sp. SIO2C9]|uniref:FkbM family methyltransferase n=1 Tax=Okeania sp. SIO2C9 TaxID=2607791 RepID=UPI0013BFDE33|nr:FkbM family methyltransferase [Okeania sp. SIO2C9]NEQ71639.1 FkbM family methyltransferase [Okeania sp. SIO2C9]